MFKPYLMLRTFKISLPPGLSSALSGFAVSRTAACERPAPGIRLLALVSLGLAWVGLAGCGFGRGFATGESGAVEPEESLEVVIGRVNENSARVDFILRGVGKADGKYLRADGKLEPFHQDAKLLFRRPRDLYLELEHSLGEDIMQIGSNSREFWVWKKVQKDRYWWGEHDQLDPHEYADLPVRPDQLVDIIGLGNLPTSVDPKTGPLFEVLPDRYQLTFLDSNGSGSPYPVKRVMIDRRSPYLVREVLYLSPTGRQHTVARLSNYGYARGTSAQVPYRIRIEWPSRGEILELDFSRLERHEGRNIHRYFTSPRQRGLRVGEEIRVDRKPAPTAAVQPDLPVHATVSQ